MRTNGRHAGAEGLEEHDRRGGSRVTASEDAPRCEADYWSVLTLRRELSDLGFADVGRLDDVQVLRESLRRPGAWAGFAETSEWQATRIGGALPGSTARPAAPAPAEDDAPPPPPPAPEEPAAPALTWIEVEVVDEEGKPYADEQFALGLPNGLRRQGQLDGDGCLRVDEIDSGHCRFDLPDLVALALDEEGAE